ncbi:hypothetical protein VP01_7g31 [Puccinia sorghi]|uniref:HPt domain-containing protein n=1 Tax=Puccinia sorghi TaxID=27349 RepID=A0A0L6UAP4_9BASI|nr:hypothetical protein VP01_7g31 [Puccinia sorghi]
MLDSRSTAADPQDFNRKNSSPSKSSPSSSRTRKDSTNDTHHQHKQPTSNTESHLENDNTRDEEKQQDKGKHTTTTATETSAHTRSDDMSPSTTRTKTTIASEDEDGTEESHQSKPQDADEQSDDGPLVDMETFGQLLEMDDDEEHSFSKSLTWDYFDQAVTTFKEMDAAVKNRTGGDLITLSRKGHFLKGSSAALGLNRVKASCEKMQHYGNKKKANGEGTLSEAEAMEKCKSLLNQLKEEQKLSKAWLERFYAERNV